MPCAIPSRITWTRRRQSRARALSADAPVPTDPDLAYRVGVADGEIDRWQYDDPSPAAPGVRPVDATRLDIADQGVRAMQIQMMAEAATGRRWNDFPADAQRAWLAGEHGEPKYLAGNQINPLWADNPIDPLRPAAQAGPNVDPVAVASAVYTYVRDALRAADPEFRIDSDEQATTIRVVPPAHKVGHGLLMMKTLRAPPVNFAEARMRQAQDERMGQARDATPASDSMHEVWHQGFLDGVRQIAEKLGMLHHKEAHVEDVLRHIRTHPPRRPTTALTAPPHTTGAGIPAASLSSPNSAWMGRRTTF